MTAYDIVQYIRSHYPETFGIRRTLQRVKIKRIRRHTLPEGKVRLCEADPAKKEQVIAPYLKKWEKYIRPCISEINEMVEKSPVLAGGYDEKEIRTDMLFCWLAYGFLPSEYIGFGFIERTPEERKEFVSDLDTSTFGYTVNNIVELQRVINKTTSALKYQKYFKRDFLIIGSRDDQAAFNSFVEKHPVFVKKKINSAMGKGVELVDIRQHRKDQLFNDLISVDKWLLEERVGQKQEMACINASSVNTVRCMTFKTKDGVVVPYCFLRAGRNGSFVDNGGAGGLLVGIDTRTGVVNTDGFSEYGERFAAHPETGIKFQGFQIPHWDQLIAICKAAAEEETDMNYLSWDMAYSERGWCVIEVNAIGQLIVPQIVQQRGIKKEIEAYLKNMDRVV